MLRANPTFSKVTPDDPADHRKFAKVAEQLSKRRRTFAPATEVRSALNKTARVVIRPPPACRAASKSLTGRQAQPAMVGNHGQQPFQQLCNRPTSHEPFGGFILQSKSGGPARVSSSIALGVVDRVPASGQGRHNLRAGQERNSGRPFCHVLTRPHGQQKASAS